MRRARDSQPGSVPFAKFSEGSPQASPHHTTPSLLGARGEAQQSRPGREQPTGARNDAQSGVLHLGRASHAGHPGRPPAKQASPT